MSATTTAGASAHGLVYAFENVPGVDERVELAPGVYWLRMPFEFGINHINLWLLEDDEGWTVIDTGFDRDSIRRIWEDWIARFLDGKPIKRVIGTHMHPDHIGLAGWLVDKYDAEFYMSRTDYLLGRAMAGDTGKKAPEAGVRFYRAAGFDEQALARYRERFGSFGDYIYPLPQSYHRMSQDDHIQIGKYTWRVEVGRGHTPEHVCLYCAELNMLIAGDQILPKISSNVSLFPTEPNANPLQDWIDNCWRLQDVLPEDCLVLPAHNDPFYGAHKRLQSLIDSHENALTRLVDICGEPRRAVDQEVFSILFKRKINGDNFSMATGESLAHLMCLVHRGILSRHVDDSGVAWYQRVN